jgi:hypothetical protein
MGKGGLCIGLTQLYNLHVLVVVKSGSLYLLEPSGACLGLYMDCFTVTFTFNRL